MHGFRGEHHGLEPVVAHLPEVRVISPDLPGFGETPPLPGRTHDIDAYAGWLRGFVAAVAPGAVILGPLVRLDRRRRPPSRAGSRRRA